MKIFISPLITVLGLIAATIIFICLMSCGEGSPEPASPQSQAQTLLASGTWKLQSESVDGVDQTALYQ